MESTPELLNVKEFAYSLGVTESCIRRWISEHKVAFVKLGRLVRIPREELSRLIKVGLQPSEGGVK